MRVLLDAGHGIDTPGKRSPDGRLREYMWNREIADLVLEGLRSSGVDCELVVTETNDIPLRTRAMRVNKVCDELGAQNVVLLSIHANAAGNGSEWMNARGWSAYTTKGNTGSDAVAEALYKAFEESIPERKIRRDTSDGDSDWEENFYILTKTRCRAVLLENYFYDNREECEWMLTASAKKRIASAIIRGVLTI